MKLQASGSFLINDILGIDSEEDTSKLSIDRLIFELYTKQILEESFKPVYRLKSNKSAMYLDVENNIFTLVAGHSSVFPLEDIEEGSDTIMGRVGNKIIKIPTFDIERVGWH